MGCKNCVRKQREIEDMAAEMERMKVECKAMAIKRNDLLEQNQNIRDASSSLQGKIRDNDENWKKVLFILAKMLYF